MKKLVLIFVVVATVAIVFSTIRHRLDKDGAEKKIIISGAWALYPITIKWAEEFQKIHPDVKIDISAGGAGKGMADALAEIVDIGNVSRQIFDDEINKGAWWVPVAKDAVVATINPGNPEIDKILKRGLRKEDLSNIWINETLNDWQSIVDCEESLGINVYTRSDSCGAAETWANSLGGKQEDLNGIGVYGDPGLADAVKRDDLSIGFNNINYAYDSKTRKQVDGITIVPLDLNGSGRIDPEEDFYDTLDQITEAISEGIYPSPPARELNFVSQGVPKKKIVREFIRWVLTDGQQYIAEAGYISVAPDRLQESLGMLDEQWKNYNDNEEN